MCLFDSSNNDCIYANNMGRYSKKVLLLLSFNPIYNVCAVFECNTVTVYVYLSSTECQ